MLDDDIEYIGISLPFHDQVVTGLILRVDKSADDPACTLTFRRAISNVVHIGRRPSTEGRVQSDKDSAMFRCAVVSRKHAKITFSDTGHIYLIDMNSHHGTHVRKPNEAVSRMLKPETPTMLSDGDTITFGKSVGRHNEYVRPIVARIELIYGPRESATLVKQIVHVDSPGSPFKSNTGRYGIYSQVSSSSENISSSISEDSDIEEISTSIPASGPNALPLQPRLPRKLDPEPSHLDRAIEALRRFLPPASAPSTAQITLPQIRPVVYTPSPVREQSLNLGFPIDVPCESLYSPRSPNWPRSPCLSPPPVGKDGSPPPFDFSSCEPREPRQDELSKDCSRSHSPMDLSSPSPAVPGRTLDAYHPAQEEPSVSGAWPAPCSASPQSSSPVLKKFSLNASEVPPKSLSPLMQKAMSLDSICSEPIPQNNGNLKTSAPVEELDVYKDSTSITANNGSDDLNAKDDSGITALQFAIKRLQDEVSKLQIYQHKYQARFDNNGHLISDRLFNLGESVSDVHAQYMTLVERIETAVDVDIPDLQAQLDVLREHIEACPNHAPNSDPPTGSPDKRADVEASISALHTLVADMHALHERTAEQMDTELRLVREARDAALAQFAVHVQAQAPAQNVSCSFVSVCPSLKRKRSNYDGAGSAVSDDNNSCDGDSGASAGDAINPLAPSPVPGPIALCCHHHSHDLPVPPSKRARRMAAVAVQTVTAVTVGAIATWSALAFS